MNRFTAKATLRDVAALAGVSTGTASQALNGHDGVSAEARDKVRAAATKLGYRPHPAARRLARRITEAVGVIFADSMSALWSHLIYNGVIHGIMEVATPAGYHLVFASIGSGGAGSTLPRIVEDRDVDGVLTLACGSPLVFHELAGRGLPAVHVDTHGAPGAELAVDNDDTAGAHEGTLHLLQLGHRRVGLIAAPLGAPFGRAVYRGYQQALGEAGIPLDRNLIGEEPASVSMEDGYNAMRLLLAQQSPPTAVFVGSDHSAIGAMKAAQAAGLRVPADVAVVGMDDLEMSAHVLPALTTLHVDYHALGRRAMRLLLARLHGSGDESPRQIIAPTLVVRDSCGARRPRGRSTARQCSAAASQEGGVAHDG